MSDFSVVYYSDGNAPADIKVRAATQLSRVVRAAGGELITVSWDLVNFGHKNLLWPDRRRSHASIYGQILAGIDAAATDTIILAEHDVLYPHDYHKTMMLAVEAVPQALVYNTNVIWLNEYGYFAVNTPHFLSNLAAHKSTLRKAILEKLNESLASVPVFAEPFGDTVLVATRNPVVDIRHGQNLTGNRDSSIHDSANYYWGPKAIWLSPSLRIFILSHRQDLLDAAPTGKAIRKVDLNTVVEGTFSNNLIGEGRAFLADHDTGYAHYLGFANARWNNKYPHLRTKLEDLSRIAHNMCLPNRVLVAWGSTDWYTHTLQVHPTMDPLLREMAALTGANLIDAPTCWAHDFICHRDVWYDWLHYWRKCFGYFHRKYGFMPPMDSTGMDVCRLPAYLYERVSALYFANRPDLEIVQLP